MTIANIVCEKCGVPLAVLDNKLGGPVVRLTTGLAFHTEGRATCPGCGQEIMVNLNVLEKQIQDVLPAD